MSKKIYCIFRENNCDFCISEELILIFESEEEAKKEIGKLQKNEKRRYFISDYTLFLAL